MSDVAQAQEFTVLVDARCLDHPRRSIGVVVRAPGGYPNWEARHKGRAAHPLYGPGRRRTTLWENLRITSRTEVEGWCRDCRDQRPVKVADLLDAVRQGSSRRPVVLA